MICPSCGRELNDDVNFCYYCGHSFREADNSLNKGPVYRKNMVSSTPAGYSGYIEPEVQRDNYRSDTSVEYDVRRAEMMRADQEKMAMSPVGWVLYFACLFIPLLWIVWIIITFVWAFGKKGSQERKNFAKGMLISVALLFAIIIIYLTVMINKYGADGTIERLTNGMYKSVDDYMNSMGK